MAPKKNVDRLVAALDLLRHYVENDINEVGGGFVSIGELQNVFIVAGQKTVLPAKEEVKSE